MKSRSLYDLHKEYLKIKSGEFASWYDKLNSNEKMMFNKILSDMRDDLSNSKKNKNKTKA
tara:strand:+ start:110 stop:289 length:180 start_codon:yes stop_codon:yes gene_type:complete